MMRRALPVAATAAISTQQQHKGRSITTRGQFNPIHDFSHCTGPQRATSEKDFEKMITNPGPLRVGYSPDYLDWLYKAYQSKVQYEDARAKSEKIFNGLLLSDSHADSGSNHANNARLPGAPPPGHVMRPAHSLRRNAGEAKRRAAQSVLDTVAKQQGMLDLFERQPQFPALHMEKATRFHIVELFKDIVLDRALSPEEIWDKALMYRAILSERRKSYPESFKYIFDAVESTVLAPSPAARSDGDSGISKADPLAGRCPSVDHYNYFLFLAKRYYVDNAIEAHVVLRCHRDENASHLLFSNPPPKDEAEVRAAIFGADAKKKTKATDDKPAGDAAEQEEGGAARSRGNNAQLRAPASYPPIEAIWRCEENLPLLKVLVFGEMNLVVSENPFVKYPNAQGYLTRPYAMEGQLLDKVSAVQSNKNNQRGGGRRDSDGVSLAKLIEEKRGHLLAPISRNVSSSLDGRANDLRRLQQRYHREDLLGFQKILKGSAADEDPANFSAFSDWSYFNPRAVRSEKREQLQRKGIEALKKYDEASQEIYRVGFEELEMRNMSRPTEQHHTVPTYIPTLPHFVAAIMKDSHVSYLAHVGLHVDSAKRQDLDRLVQQLGRCLHNTALEFYKESLRRVHRQRVNVAAALLDNFVQSEWKAMLQRNNSVDGNDAEDVQKGARRLGEYKPFEKRMWDESGFTTDARAEDYARWMAPPVAGAV